MRCPYCPGEQDPATGHCSTPACGNMAPSPDYSQRYVLYAKAHGHSPDEQMSADDARYPGGVMTGYIGWVCARWQDFCRTRGYHNTVAAEIALGQSTGAAFDAWLADEIRATADAQREAREVGRAC